MVLNNNSSTTPCPECGEPMGLVSWVGEKPVCARCSGATSSFEMFDKSKEEENECMHEALERSLPPNQRGGPHMLACNCPKCTTWC